MVVHSLLGRVIQISSIALLWGCSTTPGPAPASHTQASSLLVNGEQAKAVLLKRPSQITVSVSATSNAKRQVKWSQLQVWAGRHPFSISGNAPVMLAYGGTNLSVPLMRILRDDRKTETATFELRADAALIESLSDVILKFGDNQSSFRLPLNSEDVLARFTVRASVEELSQFENFRNSGSAQNQRRALEMVLSKLTAAELHRIGINQLLTRPSSTPAFWEIAWQQTTDPAFAAEEAMFHKVLERASCQICTGIGNCGGITWTVRQDQFFQARDALLAAKRAKLLPKTTVANGPKFTLE
jgi:hypothetical protein